MGQPSPPDPSQGINLGNQVAGQQQQYNTQAGIQSQAGSMVNQSNPYGSVNYQQTGTGPGGVPIYSANTSLSPTQQGLYNTLTGTQGTAGQQGQNLIQGANYGSAQPSDVIGNATAGNTQALLNQETSFLNPFYQTQTSQLDTQLRNQGLAPGNPAYDNAMRTNQTSQNLGVTNFLANAEPQAYQQAYQNYMAPAQLGTSLSQFSAPTTPNSSFVNAPSLSIQPANLVGATANETSALNTQYQSQLANYQNMMSGLFGIPTSILGSWAGSPTGSAALGKVLGF